MWFKRRQDWSRTVLSSVKVSIIFNTFSPTPAASYFRFWVLLCANYVCICAILMPSEHLFSQV